MKSESTSISLAVTSGWKFVRKVHPAASRHPAITCGGGSGSGGEVARWRCPMEQEGFGGLDHLRLTITLYCGRCACSGALEAARAGRRRPTHLQLRPQQAIGRCQRSRAQHQVRWTGQGARPAPGPRSPPQPTGSRSRAPLPPKLTDISGTHMPLAARAAAAPPGSWHPVWRPPPTAAAAAGSPAHLRLPLAGFGPGMAAHSRIWRQLLPAVTALLLCIGGVVADAAAAATKQRAVASAAAAADGQAGGPGYSGA